MQHEIVIRNTQWVTPAAAGNRIGQAPLFINAETVPFVHIRYTVDDPPRHVNGAQLPGGLQAQIISPFLTDFFVTAVNLTIDAADRLWRAHGMNPSFPEDDIRLCSVRAITSTQSGYRFFQMQAASLDDAVHQFDQGLNIDANSFNAEEWHNDLERYMDIFLTFEVLPPHQPAEMNHLLYLHPQPPPPRPPVEAADFFHPRQAPAAPLALVFEPPPEAPLIRIPQTRAQTRAAERAHAEAQRTTRSGARYGMPQGRDGSVRFGSKYTELKRKKLFMRGKVDDAFFSATDQVIFTPATSQGLCFVMAFMKAQLREYVLHTPDKVTSVNVSTPWSSGMMYEAHSGVKDTSVRFGITLPTEDLAADRAYLDRDFLVPSPESDSSAAEILLFNPYKERLETRADLDEFNAGFSEEYVLDWLICARAVHAFVENTLGRLVDWTLQNEVCQAYADVFAVSIHLYSYVGLSGGKRSASFTSSRSPSARERHVHLLCDASHVSAITNVRGFMAQYQSSMNVGEYNFCDVCQYTTTMQNKNRGEGLTHISKCLQGNHTFKPHALASAYGALTKPLAPKPHTRCTESFHCVDCDTTSQRMNPNCLRDHSVDTNQSVVCANCGEELGELGLAMHQCFIRVPQVKDPLDPALLWAYDIEAMQVPLESERGTGGLGRLYTHHSNCLIIRRAYEEVPDSTRRDFPDVDTFLEAILREPAFVDARFYAHNGASYDSQYILRYAEEHGIPHRSIPHPNSPHKYLELVLTRPDALTVTFRDFLPLMPGSLKGIGQSFGLSVTKGDFPHGFNRPQNQNYRGPLPALHSPEDWFGFETKRREEDQVDLQSWHDSQALRMCTCVYEEGVYTYTEDVSGAAAGGEPQWRCNQCSKYCWDFQAELRRYCYLDVVVLAECMKLYREKMMNPTADPGVADPHRDEALPPWRYWRCPSLDPFQYLTASQIALTIFLAGFHPERPMNIASVQYTHRDNYNPLSSRWIYDLNLGFPLDDQIQYRGNSVSEFYSSVTGRFYDGYHPRTNTIYFFRDCEYYACACKGYLSRTDLHRRRNISVESVEKTNAVEMRKLRDAGFQVVVCRSHTIERTGASPIPLIEDREMLYGGRTEVHHAYFEPQQGEEIIYDDVCSMYPYVCAFKPLPVGHPDLLVGPAIDPERLRPGHPNPYYGYAKVRIVPNRQDELGLLPSRDPVTKRLEFNLHPKDGVWHTEELTLAQEQGYVVEEVYQVYHWPKSRVSDSLFRGYVSYFLRQKQESDGWKKAGASSNDPSEEEKEAVIAKLCEENGGIGRMDKDRVRVDPVGRALAKLNLNSLWGKFVQSRHDDYSAEINGMLQYSQFMSHPNLDPKTVVFRHVKDNYFKVSFRRLDEVKPNRNTYNVWVGSGVTAHARTILNRRSLEVGVRNVIYTDTDSIIYARKTQATDERSKGLGKWQNEKPGKVIESVTALAPKNYMLKIRGEEELEMKSKGVVLHVQNKERIHQGLLNQMLSSKVETFVPEGVQRESEIQMDNFNIFSNSTRADMPYAQLVSRVGGQKTLRPVLTKRQIVQVYNADVEGKPVPVTLGGNVKKIRLLPFGHEKLEKCSGRELSEEVYGRLFE